MKKTFMDRNSLLTVILLLLLSFFKEMTVIVKLLYLWNVKVYIHLTYYPVSGVLRAYEVQGKERQLGSTDLYVNRLQIRISLTET